MSKPILVHDISRISWSIIGSADLVAFSKTGAAAANHVFDVYCDTRPINMFFYSGNTLSIS